jgi:hypothetical protein
VIELLGTRRKPAAAATFAAVSIDHCHRLAGSRCDRQQKVSAGTIAWLVTIHPTCSVVAGQRTVLSFTYDFTPCLLFC